MLALDDLRIFATIADSGGVAPAARALGCSKSMVSEVLNRLERTLGVPLAERTTRQFLITAQGEQLLSGCREMLEIVRLTEDGIARARSTVGGTLRVSCPPGLADHLAAKVIPSFLCAHPGVTIDALVVNRPVNIIAEGIDVAFRVRTSLDDDQSLMQRTLGRTVLRLVASAEYAASAATISEPRQLKDIATLGLQNGVRPECWTFAHRTKLPQVKVKVRLQPRLRCDDWSVLLSAARSGLGAALIPDHLCRDDIRSGALIELMPLWAPPPALVHAVFSSGPELRFTVRTFIDHVAQSCADGEIF